MESKQKFLARIDEDPTRSTKPPRKTAITLPRLGFEMVGLTYDSTRKLNRVQKFKKTRGGDDKNMMSQYQPVPYNIGFTLYAMAKNSDDALQIVEQILPYFQPDYTVTLNLRPTMDIVRDVPIILNDVTYEDSYEGDFSSRRVLMYTLNFTTKNYLYDPVTSQKVIKSVQVDQYSDMPVNTLRENKDIQLHLIQWMQMVTITLVSMKQLLSSKMQKTLILRLVLMSNNILCQKLMIR